MCEQCFEVIQKHFPDADEDTNFGINGEYESEVLWGATAFPFCDAETLDRQLTELFDAKKKGESICWLCGNHFNLPDGTHIGATCVAAGLEDCWERMKKERDARDNDSEKG